jgi:nascent polypeptide-associated complex subunit beta
MGVNTIPGIEEVLLINEDGSALQFNNPKVQASIGANTYVVSGPSQHKNAQEILASLFAGMGGGVNMQQMMQAMQGMQGAAGLEGAGDDGEDDDDDDIPELVGNFDNQA